MIPLTTSRELTTFLYLINAIPQNRNIDAYGFDHEISSNIGGTIETKSPIAGHPRPPEERDDIVTAVSRPTGGWGGRKIVSRKKHREQERKQLQQYEREREKEELKHGNDGFLAQASGQGAYRDEWAATKIQSSYRGHAERKEARRKQRVRQYMEKQSLPQDDGAEQVPEQKRKAPSPVHFRHTHHARNIDKAHNRRVTGMHCERKTNHIETRKQHTIRRGKKSKLSNLGSERRKAAVLVSLPGT